MAAGAVRLTRACCRSCRLPCVFTFGDGLRYNQAVGPSRVCLALARTPLCRARWDRHTGAA
jgi:hypothetical protein